MKVFHAATIGAAIFVAVAIAVIAPMQSGIAQSGTGSSSRKAAMPTARSEVSVAASTENYAIGHINRFAVPHVEEYDPESDKWRPRLPIPGPRSHGHRRRQRQDHYGGRFHPSVHAHPQAAVYEYDPAADTWRELAAMKAPRASVGVAVLTARSTPSAGATLKA